MSNGTKGISMSSGNNWMPLYLFEQMILAKEFEIQFLEKHKLGE